MKLRFFTDSTVFWFLLFFALALITRGYGLGTWTYSLDEFFTAYHSAERMWSIKNPAYYALVTWSFAVFGASEWAARLPSFFFGSLAIPVFFLVWRRNLGIYSAICSSFLLLFSSYMLGHGQFARFYAAVFLFGGLAYYLFWTAISKDSMSCFLGSLVCQFLAIAFHLTALLLPVSLVVYCLIAILLNKSKTNDSGLYVRWVWYYISLGGACLLVCLPFALKVLYHWNATGQSWGYGPFNLILQCAKYIQIPVVMLAFFGAIYMLREDQFKGLYFLVASGVPILIMVVCSTRIAVRPDYIIYTVPMILGLAGYFLQLLAHNLVKKSMASVVTVVLIAVMMPEFISHYSSKKSVNLRQVVMAVQQRYSEGDQLLSFINGMNFYSEEKFQVADYVGDVTDDTIDWNAELCATVSAARRTWILVPVSRRPVAAGLERWLLSKAQLVWRENAKRYDYTAEGFELYQYNKEDNCLGP